MNLGHELKALDAINNVGLWFTLTTSCDQLKPLNVVNKLGLWMT